jgi:hypothetical protein
MSAAVTRPALDRPITPQESAVIPATLEHAPKMSDISRFASGIDQLHVISRCGCGCDSVDFAKLDPAHPSQIIVDGVGVTAKGGQVAVLV